MNKILNPNPLGNIISLRLNLLTFIRVFLLLIGIGLSQVYANSAYTHPKFDNSNETILSSTAKLQETTITGKVTNSYGVPLPGANVIVKGTSRGTQTDIDGNYTITVDANSTLVFSYIGFTTQEVVISDQTVVNVSLSEDTGQLSEIVVIGYTTQTRGDLTGSVASVDMSEAVKAPIVNAAEALQGRVTGVSVVTSAQPGAPPKTTIRGFGTSNNTNPLFIIDGIQTDDPYVLNNINPGDIEEMNVLKDGAAAIYGARASNGVIIITTKSGRYDMEKAIFNVDVYTGISEAMNIPDNLNTQQHGAMIWESLSNDGATLTHPQYGTGPSPVVPSSLIGPSEPTTIRPGGTNWLETILQTAQIQNVSLSLQNGTATGKYFMSASYLNREGIMLHTGYKRGSTRLNSEFKIKDKVVIGEHFNIAFASSKDGVGEAIQNGFRSSPLIPAYDDNGNFAGTFSNSFGLGNARSPLAQLYRSKNNFNKTLMAFGDIYMSAELMEGLTFKTILGGRMTYNNQRSFNSLDPEHGEAITSNTLYEDDYTRYDWSWSNTLNYKNDFGDHSLNVLVGVEAGKGSQKGKGISRTDYLFEDPDFYLLSNGSGTPNVGYAYDGASSLFSVFGTTNYSYQGKYFATATVRYDESSRFKGDNKSDVFPSFSAGWLISKEDFFPGGGKISRLKIRGSWGQLGNQTLPSDNPTINISNLNEELSNYSFNGNTITTGAMLSQVGNPNLKWETSVVMNFGVELGLFENSLNVSLEFFDIKTEDLITRDNSLISTTAIDADAPLVNLGNVKNTGFDLGIGYNKQTSSGYNYGIQVNISKYKNEVTKLISDFQLGNDGFRGGAVTRTEVGQPISSFYGRVVEGIDGNGRFQYQDINNDGTINDDDRTYIGSPHPDFTFGVNLTAGYESFDMSMFFSGSQGNDIYNYEKIYTDFPTFFNGNRSTRVLNSWTPSNTNTTLPALSQTITNNETSPNSYFIEDGSYIRLKNLQVGYTFSDDLASKIGADSFRLYVQGSNLFTISGYDGFDPEIISNDNLTLGVNNQVYPLARILSIGVNLKF